MSEAKFPLILASGSQTTDIWEQNNRIVRNEKFFTQFRFNPSSVHTLREPRGRSKLTPRRPNDRKSK